jgi:hypothetical protein
MTATLLTAVPGQTPTNVSSQPLAPVVQNATAPGTTETPPTQRLTLRDRIRNFFHGNQPDKTETTATPPVTVRQAPPVINAPAGSRSLQQDPIQPRTMGTVTVLRPSLSGEANDLDKAGHEKDYSWITGRLARDNGRWVIRYAGPNEVDRFGGRLVLTGNADLSKVQHGDLVCVLGQVVNIGRPIVSGTAGAAYQVREINVIEHAR